MLLNILLLPDHIERLIVLQPLKLLLEILNLLLPLLLPLLILIEMLKYLTKFLLPILHSPLGALYPELVLFPALTHSLLLPEQEHLAFEGPLLSSDALYELPGQLLLLLVGGRTGWQSDRGGLQGLQLARAGGAGLLGLLS